MKKGDKYFIDCGSHCGESIVRAKGHWGSDTNIIGFEAIPYFANELSKLYEDDDTVMIQNSIVWDKSTIKRLYVSDNWTDGSSVYLDKGLNEGKRTVSEKSYVDVPAFNLSRWILDSFEKSTYLILKLDVEGSEFRILNKMIEDGSIEYVDELWGEWHDMKIDVPEINELSAKVKDYLEANGIPFNIWETLYTFIPGETIKRPDFKFLEEEYEKNNIRNTK